jgi:hypothetical protein
MWSERRRRVALRDALYSLVGSVGRMMLAGLKMGNDRLYLVIITEIKVV